MKKRDIEELKKKPESELRKRLGDAREKLRVLKFDLAAGKVKSAHDLRESKKEIARILTFLAEKAHNEQPAKQ